MNEFPKFLLDSGDPDEYRTVSQLAKQHGSELWGAPSGASLWGSTTNPSLIAKQLAGKKISQKEAFELQKQIVLEIIDIVPGAVSAEVYADNKTSSNEMIEQGREIATWHERVVVKLPTTIEGFRARTALRKEKIPTNNTLVFSQQQIFAICLHERIMQEQFGPIDNLYPPFISPFVGRLDDQNEDGMRLLEHGMQMKQEFGFFPWMLQASVRKVEHIKRGYEAGVELITAPIVVYKQWFSLQDTELENLDSQSYAQSFTSIPFWNPPESLLATPDIKTFMEDITTGRLNISHPLTDAGITRFAQDWKKILRS